MTNPIFIIITGDYVLSPVWDRYVTGISAPANYKDPVKIQEYIDKKTASLENDILNESYALIDLLPGKFHCWVPNYLDIDREDPLGDILWDSIRMAGIENVVIVGDNAKAILFRMFVHSRLQDGVSGNLLRKHLMLDNIRFTTIAEMFLNPFERKNLNVSKLLPERNEEDESEYIHNVLLGYGLIQEEELVRIV